jgi:cytochrome c peroxidase
MRAQPSLRFWRWICLMLLLVCSATSCQRQESPATPTDRGTPVSTESTTPAADVTGTPYEVSVPLGLPPLPIPDDNPMTVEKIELGKLLYFDKRLSADGTISCATCHDPQMAWAEDTPTSTGIGGQVGDKNSPTVINAAYAPVQFWDGRASSLEEQALGPIENPIEMGHDLKELVPQLNKIEDIPGYRQRFQEVFNSEVTSEGMAKAIAAFERTILSGNSPYDQYQAGDESAMTEAQQRGMRTFEDIGCSSCHASPLFSNYKFYNAGIGMDKDPPDEGRMAVTGDERDLGKFRVPSLREVANTAPYFHDGSVATLEEAVALMTRGGIDNPNLSPLLRGIGTREVSDQEIADVVEFLKALSGDFPVIEPPTSFPQFD